MSQLTPELITEIDEIRSFYRRRARRQELTYWTGSSAAAICSAVAGLSIAADISLWNPPFGKIAVSLLAIVPVVWAAAERSLRVRSLSLFNWNVATELKALSIELRFGGEMDAKTAANRYAHILRRAQEAVVPIMSSDTSDAQPPAGNHPNQAPTKP